MVREPGWDAYLAEHEHGQASASPDFWDRFLQEHPDVLHRMLADIWAVTRGAETPPSLEDLWDIVTAPRFATGPFGEAVISALNGRSVRWLGVQAGIPQSTLHKLISGERPVVVVDDPEGSMRRLEQIARALRVHPSYFAE